MKILIEIKRKMENLQNNVAYIEDSNWNKKYKTYAAEFHFNKQNYNFPFVKPLNILTEQLESLINIEENILEIDYHTSTFTKEERTKRTFKSPLPFIQGGRILEIGCSRGLTSKEINSIYPNCSLIAIDINPHCVKESRVNGVNSYLADGYFPHLYFKPNSFDAIITMNNLSCVEWKIPDSTFEMILKSITSVMKPEGHLLIGNIGARLMFKKLNEGFEASEWSSYTPFNKFEDFFLSN